jgi:predicted MFS family arabinose efflux permease
MSEAHPGVPVGLGARIRQAVSDALAYWEPRRLVYNAMLALIVVTYFVLNWPQSRTAVSVDGVLILFVLAVLANVCYCAAYLGDVFVQISGFREAWQKWRWLLFGVGMVFAAIITRWFAIGFFVR